MSALIYTCEIWPMATAQKLTAPGWVWICLFRRAVAGRCWWSRGSFSVWRSCCVAVCTGSHDWTIRRTHALSLCDPRSAPASPLVSADSAVPNPQTRQWCTMYHRTIHIGTLARRTHRVLAFATINVTKQGCQHVHNTEARLLWLTDWLIDWLNK